MQHKAKINNVKLALQLQLQRYCLVIKHVCPVYLRHKRFAVLKQVVA